MFVTTISTVGLRETLSDILSRVRHTGERVIITRSGKPVAALVPVDELRALEKLEDEYFVELADEAKKEGAFHDLDEVLEELGQN